MQVFEQRPHRLIDCQSVVLMVRFKSSVCSPPLGPTGGMLNLNETCSSFYQTTCGQHLPAELIMVMLGHHRMIRSRYGCFMLRANCRVLHCASLIFFHLRPA